MTVGGGDLAVITGLSWAGLQRFGGAALNLVLPPRALDEARAQRFAVQSHGLSAEAWTRIAFIEAPFCDACGAPQAHDLGPGAICAACLGRTSNLDRARAACVYDEHARDLILKLKHADRTDLAGLFAHWIARAAADILPEQDAIVPTPLHPLRLLSRRYNQAAEIARPLARLTGVEYFADPLTRVRRTASQGGKSADGRRRNMAGAFAVPARWRARLAGKRILLIDDVLTTGATAESCARSLKAAGAARVDLAVIARVSLPAAR